MRYQNAVASPKKRRTRGQTADLRLEEDKNSIFSYPKTISAVTIRRRIKSIRNLSRSAALKVNLGRSKEPIDCKSAVFGPKTSSFMLSTNPPR